MPAARTAPRAAKRRSIAANAFAAAAVFGDVYLTQLVLRQLCRDTA